MQFKPSNRQPIVINRQPYFVNLRLDWRDFIVYLAFVTVFLFFAITIGDQGFLTISNISNIIRATTMITIMATAMTFVIASGEIDLSIGATVAFAALCTSLAMQAGLGLIGGIVSGLLAGVLIGSINGFLTTIVAIPSFLVTLGMMQLVRGVAMWMTDTSPVPVNNENFLKIFGTDSIGPIPTLVIWSVSVLFIGHILLKKTSFGRKILATGGNSISASYSGVNTKKVKFYALIISGIGAAIAGMLYSGAMQSARYTFGQADELTVIAAVILGGTNLYGGRGSVAGTIAGSLLIGTINNGLIIIGLSVSQQMVISGAIIILAVAFGKKRTSA
ncbi:ABC transporter permease [Radiobacillus sp. PE A8.2]|uniref:ABC transporter permease n=1 Tax=Radiobacillus sp. PE A8.2 TaxID=3380349 RepID=UPI00389105C3